MTSVKLKQTLETQTKQELQLQTKLQPQLAVYLQLLHYNYQELEQLKNQLLENPFLELGDSDSELLPDGEEVEEVEDFEFDSVEEDESEDQDDHPEGSDEEVDIEEFGLDDEFINYDDYEPSENGEESGEDFTDNLPQQETFKDDLVEQLRSYLLPEQYQILGETIIQNLSDTGFLEESPRVLTLLANIQIVRTNLLNILEYLQYNNSENSAYREQIAVILQHLDNLRVGDNEYLSVHPWQEQIQNIAAKLNIGTLIPLVSVEDTEKVRQFILYHLEPPGLAAYSRKESWIVQLQRKYKEHPAAEIAIKILSEAYEDFLHHRFELLERKLQISHQQLKDAIFLIKQLQFNPGEGSSPSEPDVIIPDFIVSWNEQEQSFLIQLNDPHFPPIRFNKKYEELLKDKNKLTKKEKKNLSKDYYTAYYLHQALQNRRATMLRIMHSIVKHQEEFFRTGDPSTLKPLIYRHIEEDTKDQISTISRAVKNKYVQTDHGIYSLRFFFSEGVATRDGEKVAQQVIKLRLQELIKNEPPEAPYTDEQLAELLSNEGYHVARRTVTKYRKELKIPSARERRRIV